MFSKNPTQMLQRYRWTSFIVITVLFSIIASLLIEDIEFSLMPLFGYILATVLTLIICLFLTMLVDCGITRAFRATFNDDLSNLEVYLGLKFFYDYSYSSNMQTLLRIRPKQIPKYLEMIQKDPELSEELAVMTVILKSERFKRSDKAIKDEGITELFSSLFIKTIPAVTKYNQENPYDTINFRLNLTSYDLMVSGFLNEWSLKSRRIFKEETWKYLQKESPENLKVLLSDKYFYNDREYARNFYKHLKNSEKTQEVFSNISEIESLKEQLKNEK